MAGFGVRAAGLLDARPQFSRGAKFRHGQKLIGIGRQPEIDRVARCGERHAVGFERAQIGDRARQRKGQFLRFRAAGIMDDAAIGDGERTAETGRGKLADHRGKIRRKFFPAPRPAAGSGKAADRIDAGAQIDLCRRDAAALTSAAKSRTTCRVAGERLRSIATAVRSMPSSTRASVAGDGSRPNPLALTEPANTSTRPVAPFSRSSSACALAAAGSG